MSFSAILSQLAQSLLDLALPILAAYLARELKQLLADASATLAARSNAESRAVMQAAADIAVRAAEQMGGAADQKLTMAVKIAGQYLAEHDVHLDLVLLRGLIEASVREQFGKP